MKRVCHIICRHDRDDTRVFYNECVSIAEGGYEVYLVVNDDLPNEVRQGVHIISTGFVGKNRYERMYQGAMKIYRKALEVDADLYHLHEPELLLIAKKLKKREKKVIFDSHEDTEKQIAEKEWIPKPIRKTVSFLYKNYAKSIMNKLDALITVTPSIVEKLRRYNSNTVMITNYPRIDKLSDATDDFISMGKKRYICFAGGIFQAWMHDVILDAIMQIDDIRYVLAGYGEEKYLEYLRSLAGWEKVDYLGMIPHEQVGKILQHAIAGIAINTDIEVRGEGTLGVTKIFEYMAAGIPVICANYRLWKEMVEDNGCGICVNAKSVEEVAKAISYLIDHPEEAAEMGRNGRKAVLEKYNWNIEEKKLMLLYHRLLG